MEQKDLNVYDIFGEVKNTDNTENDINTSVDNESVQNSIKSTSDYYDDDYLIEKKIEELLGNSYDSSFGDVDSTNKFDSFNIKTDDINNNFTSELDMPIQKDNNNEQIEIIDLQQPTINDSNNNINYFNDDESVKFDEFVTSEIKIEEPVYEDVKENNTEIINEKIDDRSNDIKSLNTTYLNDDGTVETIDEPIIEKTNEVKEEVVSDNISNNEKSSSSAFIIIVFILIALTIIFLPYIYDLLK